MTIFLLPTHGATTYKGKYPNRARSVSASSNSGRHVELNSGVRLWSFTDKSPEFNAPEFGADYTAILERAAPMTSGQYVEMERASQLRSTLINYAGNTKRAAIEEQVRAILHDIGGPIVPATPTPAPRGPVQHSSHFWQHDAANEEHCRDCACMWNSASASEPCAPLAVVEPDTRPDPSAPVRRDNVEYRAGRVAFLSGEPMAAMPYSPNGERAARWNLGYCDASDKEAEAAAINLPPVDPVRAALLALATVANETNSLQPGTIAGDEMAAALAAAWAALEATPAPFLSMGHLTAMNARHAAEDKAAPREGETRPHSWNELTEGEKNEARERGFPRGPLVCYYLRKGYRDGQLMLSRYATVKAR